MNERKSEEPSMEEILASIRRIISEDAGVGAESAPRDASSGERKDEVLELMDEVQDDGTVKRLMREPAAPATAAAPLAPAAPAPVESGLISPAASTQSTRSLAELASAVAQEEAKKGFDIPLGTSERTLADIVTELLRPLLREWLDKNLPDVIERLVRKEIEKLVRRVEDR